MENQVEITFEVLNEKDKLVIQSPDIVYISAETVKISCIKDTRFSKEGLIHLFVDGEEPKNLTCEYYYPGISYFNRSEYCIRKSFQYVFNESFISINRFVNVECLQNNSGLIKEKSDYKLLKLCQYLDS